MVLPLVPSLARAPLRILCEVFNLEPPSFLANFLAANASDGGGDHDATSPYSESDRFSFGTTTLGSTTNTGHGGGNNGFGTTATFNGTMTSTQEGFDGTATSSSSSSASTANTALTEVVGGSSRNGSLRPFTGRASPATAFLHAMASEPSPNSGGSANFGENHGFSDNPAGTAGSGGGLGGRGSTFGGYDHNAAPDSGNYHNPLVPMQGESPGRFNRRSTLDSVLGEMTGLIRAFEGSGRGGGGALNSEEGHESNTNTNSNALLPPSAAASATTNPSPPPASAWAFAPIDPISSRSNSGSGKVITPAIVNKPRNASPKLRAGTKIPTPAEAAQAEFAAAADEVGVNGESTRGAGKGTGASIGNDANAAETRKEDGDDSPSAAASAAAAAAAHPPLPPSTLFTYAQPTSTGNEDNVSKSTGNGKNNNNSGKKPASSNTASRGRRSTPLRRGGGSGTGAAASGASGRRSRSRTGSPSLPRSLSRGPSGRGSSAALFASAVRHMCMLLLLSSYVLLFFSFFFSSQICHFCYHFFVVRVSFPFFNAFFAMSYI